MTESEHDLPGNGPLLHEAPSAADFTPCGRDEPHFEHFWVDDQRYLCPGVEGLVDPLGNVPQFLDLSKENLLLMNCKVCGATLNWTNGTIAVDRHMKWHADLNAKLLSDPEFE